MRNGISWRPKHVVELEEFVDATSLDRSTGQVRFAVARQSDDSLIGTVGLHSFARQHRSAEVAYDVHPVCWGRGVATAACEAMTRWAQSSGIFRIQATALEDNIASIRVLQRCKFRHEGTLRGYRWVDGAPRTSLMFSSIPEDV